MTDPYGPWDDDVEEPRRGAPGRRSPRARVADLVARYQSARLGTQVAIDVLAACLVMGVVVTGAILVDDDDSRRSVTSAAGPRTTVADTAATTTSTLAPTTAAPTTVAPTTSMPPPAPTTTRVPRTTTTPAPAPTAPPATDAPAGPPPSPSPSPSPSTSRPDRDPAQQPYRNCIEAWLARDIPLTAGEPGYSGALDPDGDGEACEWNERD